jgi:hypothetical protein
MINLKNKVELKIYLFVGIFMCCILWSGCKDEKAIQLALINAESAMAEGNIEKAIESYRILLVHDKNDTAARTNLSILESSLNALQGEQFFVFNKKIKQLVVNTNKIQKLNKAADIALDLEARYALFSFVYAKIDEKKDDSEKVFAAMIWLEKSEELVESIEKLYETLYSSVSSKSLKADTEESSLGYLFAINNQWKSVLKVVDNVGVRNELEEYDIYVRDVSGGWLPSARVISQVHDKIGFSSTHFKDRFGQIPLGWDAGKRLIEHFKARKQTMKTE